MKKINLAALSLLTITLLLTNCKKDNKSTADSNTTTTSTAAPVGVLKTAAAQKKFDEGAARYKLTQRTGRGGPQFSMAQTTTALCPGSTVSGTAVPGGIFASPLQATYYTFYGHAGDVININVTRTNCAMDPAFSLFYGTTSDYSTVVNPFEGGSNLQFLEFHDDELNPPSSCANTCAPYYDPQLTNYTLPSTGTYTLAVYDYISCGSSNPLTYNLTVTGIADCTIIIDGCNTGVPNSVLSTGGTMEDAILAKAAGARNHGAFVSAVTQLAHQWVQAGLITGAQKGAITSCAASSSLPH